jgi:maltose alpha-D-glucosyltransferase/alpha-amylase
MVTSEERQWMWEQYASEPRMRLNQGIRRRLAPLLDNNRRKIELANSLLFTLPGSPIIYYGDEIGMGDNIWLDDRNGLRTPMQWDDSPTAGFTKAQPFASVLDGYYSPKHVNVAAQIADPDSLFCAIRRMISIRKEHQAFGWGSFEWVDVGSNAIAAYKRMHADETMLILNNLSDQQQTVHFDEGQAVNAFTGESVLLGSLIFKPFEYLWFILKS